MKSGEQISKAVEDTFKVLDTIEEVKVNHFFKHKVLQQIENQQEEKSTVIKWFTPQLQLATLSIILFLNLGVILYSSTTENSSTDNTIESFAQEYTLQSETIQY